jgi:hypothetical protein
MAKAGIGGSAYQQAYPPTHMPEPGRRRGLAQRKAEIEMKAALA